MTILNNALDAIKYKKDFCYSKAVPTLVSNNIGISDEIARWVLDRNAILYKNENHPPVISRKKVNKIIKEKGTDNSPVLQMTDALIYSTDSVVLFWEQRCLAKNRLLPEKPELKDEVLDLYHLFTGEFFETKVTKFMYAQLLSSRKFACKVFKEQISFFDKLIYTLGYPFFKKALFNEYNLKANSTDDYLIEIKKIFAKIDAMLSDGRRYLVGNQFTLADLSFAAIAAPLILPEEFGGVLPEIYEVPDAYRKDVIAMRATPAGQFVLRIYQEDRPVMLPQSQIPKEPGLIGKLIGRVLISLKKGQSGLYYSLQKHFPILKVPFLKIVLVTKNDLLVEMMSRDEDFTVEEINSKRMADQKGAFFLGMDRNNPQFDRERDFVRKATKREDLELIRSFIRASSEEIIKNAQVYGKLDVANSYCKVVIVRLIAYYFGVSAPTETIMKKWLRDLFFDLFLNLANNKKKHELALKAANERRDWLIQIIKDRRQDLKDGKTLDDNIFNRLIIMSQQPGYEWVDEDVLQRNIGGLITGILETTNKAVVLVLEELFNKPEVLKAAIEVANSGDMVKMYGYVSEALRFNPVQPGVIRYSESKHILTGKGTKLYTIPAKRKVLALTSAAMFDPQAFPDPKKFIADRPSVVYMNYGFALHECYGRYINAVTLSEFTATVLRLKNVRREPGRTGRGMGIAQESFPNNFVVRFD